MKLERIGYGSAVIFGILSLIMYLIMGVVSWSMRDALLVTQGVVVTPLQVFVVAPLIGGVAGYLFTMLGILLYNLVAKKFPFSWEIRK